MTRLDCSVKNCYFNNEMKCAKDEIQVEGKEATTTDSTECSSFRMNNSTAKNSTGCKLTPNEELKVACNAVNCVYNRNEVCNAGHIDIAGISADRSEQTECGTFRMK